MTLRRLIPSIGVALFALAVFSAPAPAGELDGVTPSALAYARGGALLAKGDVDGAAAAYLEAARAEPGNQTYRDRAMALRRVQGLRRFARTEDRSERWARAVYSLHIFYLQNGVPALAVELDTTAHQRLKTMETAEWLAEAQLAANAPAAAANVLSEYSAASPRHAVLHSIALARLGQVDAARAMAARGGTTNEAAATAAQEWDLARMYALVGQAQVALPHLVHAFEKTPAASLPAWKRRAQEERDFASLATLPAFASAMQTASKVAQTCSGGSSCASCPNRGKCGGG